MTFARTLVAVVLTFAVATGEADAQVYRCKTATGGTEYSKAKRVFSGTAILMPYQQASDSLP